MWLIAPRLYLGNYRSALDALNGMEYPVHPSEDRAPFAAVISLCEVPLYSDPGPFVPASEETCWLRCPIADGGRGEQEFERTLQLVLPFIQERLAHGNVLVHCAAGMSRSVSVVAAVLCARGWSVSDAYQHIAVTKAAAVSGLERRGLLIAPAREFQTVLHRLYPTNSEFSSESVRRA